MRIIFTAHLHEKIQERRIAFAKVEITIRHPDFTRPTYYGREERYRKFNKNYLMVIVKQEDFELIAITVHWVEKLPRQ